MTGRAMMAATAGSGGLGFTMKAILLSRTGDPSVLDYVEVPTPAPAAGRGAGQGRHHRREPAGASGARAASIRGCRRCRPFPASRWPAPWPSAARARRASRSATRSTSARASCRSAPAATPNTSRCRSARCSRCRRGADLEAAACLSNYQVAWHLLHTATRGAPGKTALIGQASGGLGSAAVQLAKLAGMTAIALVGCAREGARAESLRRRPRHRLSPARTSRPASRTSPAAPASISCSMRPAARTSRKYLEMLGAVRPRGVLRQARRTHRRPTSSGARPGTGLSQQRRGADLHHAHARRQARRARAVDERSHRETRRRRDPPADPRAPAAEGRPPRPRDDRGAAK